MGALGASRQAQARVRVVRSRRRVGMVIVLVKEMLREFVGREGGMFVCGDDRRVAAFARDAGEILIGVGFL